MLAEEDTSENRMTLLCGVWPLDAPYHPDPPIPPVWRRGSYQTLNARSPVRSSRLRLNYLPPLWQVVIPLAGILPQLVLVRESQGHFAEAQNTAAPTGPAPGISGIAHMMGFSLLRRTKGGRACSAEGSLTCGSRRRLSRPEASLPPTRAPCLPPLSEKPGSLADDAFSPKPSLDLVLEFPGPPQQPLVGLDANEVVDSLVRSVVEGAPVAHPVDLREPFGSIFSFFTASRWI